MGWGKFEGEDGGQDQVAGGRRDRESSREGRTDGGRQTERLRT